VSKNKNHTNFQQQTQKKKKEDKTPTNQPVPHQTPNLFPFLLHPSLTPSVVVFQSQEHLSIVASAPMFASLGLLGTWHRHIAAVHVLVYEAG
jgi:hypothetical protein